MSGIGMILVQTVPPGPELAVFLSWLLSGGFDVLVRWFVSLFPDLMERLTEIQRGFLSAGLGTILVCAAFTGLAFMGVLPMPDPTVLAWVMALFPYVAVALGLPTLMSAAFQRRFEKRLAQYERDLSAGEFVPASHPEFSTFGPLGLHRW